MNAQAKPLMFLGTGSDVGKSIVAAAFCRILARRGVRTAPFKAQNMSNNSYITIEGGEIGRAQVVQAEAAGLEPTNDMNPILLKPTSGLGSQVVVQGRVWAQMSAAEYYRRKKELVGRVMESYRRLAGRYEAIVLEGAGSCGELNLKKSDLVNFAMAKRIDAPCVLVADIDRGGVFAQTIGTMSLLTPTEKRLTAGFVINKFRGDARLFDDGKAIIEKRAGRPVFGVVPYYDHIHIDPEDSVAVQVDKRPLVPTRPDRVNVAVLKLPGISNFTDVEALERETDLVVNYLTRPQSLAEYDMLILPGTKATVEDMVWLRKTGWIAPIDAHVRAGGTILGLCGGYQMMGREIRDPDLVESSRTKTKGLGLAPLITVMAGDKALRRVAGVDLAHGEKVEGYEIHMGRTWCVDQTGHRPLVEIRQSGSAEAWTDGWISENGRVMGCYVHGLLDSPGWRRRLLNDLRKRKGLAEKKRAGSGRSERFRQYDRLADHFERHVDVDRVLEVMGL